ncbi:MAG: GNAT family N-acetyltransferase [Acidobacteriaceae bacterium]|jgi:ribosomal protein S18 acetylase RimI-like enzyme
MKIGLRPAVPADYGFCKNLYLTENQWILEALHLDRTAHEASFSEQWKLPEVRIVVGGGVDIGWLQSAAHPDGLFLGQLYIVRPLQRQGIGAEIVSRLIAEAAQANLPLKLDVVKINPALRLYQRLGFRITGEEEHKFSMTLDPPPIRKP